MRLRPLVAALACLAAVLALPAPSGADSRTVPDPVGDGDEPSIDATSARVWNNTTGVTARIHLPEFDPDRYWRVYVAIERRSDDMLFEAAARRKAGGGFGTSFSFTPASADGEATRRACPIKHVVRSTSVTVQVPRSCFRSGTARVRLNMQIQAFQVEGVTIDDSVPEPYWTPYVSYN